MAEQRSDVVSNSAAEHVSERLGLKYENVMSVSRMMTITVATVSLLFTLLWMQNLRTQWDILWPMASLGVFVRLAFGSPMVRRLTPESRARLLEWLQSEEAQQESSHGTTDPE